MTTPVIAHRKGFYYEVKAGQRYLWCACGRSKSQPFCDGSHEGTGVTPVLFKAKADEEVIFCGCKHTGTGPFCDGTHSNLPGGYRLDDPDSPENRAVALAPPGAEPKVQLDGACYVFTPARARLSNRGSFSWTPVISPALGALFQSQFYAEARRGRSPVISADARHTVIFVSKGEGVVEISGRAFPLAARNGCYIAPREAWRIHNPHDEPIRLYVSQGPGAEDLVFAEAMPENFDAAHPARVAEIDPAQRHAMAERFFQILVSKDHGSVVVTQFIGNIPLSKAEPHKHLYEEALIILAGQGVVWTESAKTPVGPGDVLFLPRKQTHSVQCVSETGMDVVGVIYPGDNPAINY